MEESGISGSNHKKTGCEKMISHFSQPVFYQLLLEPPPPPEPPP